MLHLNKKSKFRGLKFLKIKKKKKKLGPESAEFEILWNRDHIITFWKEVFLDFFLLRKMIQICFVHSVFYALKVKKNRSDRNFQILFKIKEIFPFSM